MKIDNKFAAGYIVIFTVSTLLTSYLLIDNHYIKIPKRFLLPHRNIVLENKDTWDDELKLFECIEKDRKRSNYIQDDFVVDFPMFNSSQLSESLVHQLKWLCTQSIAQYGFMTIYNYLKRNNPNVQLIQSKHVRKILIEDYKMEYMFCCDLVDSDNVTNVIGHTCNNIIIRWNDSEITKIEMISD